MALPLRKGLEWALGFKFRDLPVHCLSKVIITLKRGGEIPVTLFC